MYYVWYEIGQDKVSRWTLELNVYKKLHFYIEHVKGTFEGNGLYSKTKKASRLIQTKI